MNRRVLFAVYHDIDTNGRSQQMLRCCEILGKTTLITFHRPESFCLSNDTDVIVSGHGKRRYMDFLRAAKAEIAAIKPSIVFLHDNYCAPLIPFIRRKCPSAFVVYDSSELYIDKKPGGIIDTIAYIIQRQENKYISKADFVIAANIERARIMHKYFRLKIEPYVFENVRRITESVNQTECDIKFGQFLQRDKFIIFYAGGISKTRRTYDLITAVKQLGEQYVLLLAGKKEMNEQHLFEMAMNASSVDNVHYLGYIKRSEMKYLFNKVDVSVSVFLQDTINNINCASGKFYESVFEGCPVLTSTNPPLQRLCEIYHLGISTDDFQSGILEMQNKIEYYRDKAKEFAKSIDLDDSIHKLSQDISDRLG